MKTLVSVLCVLFMFSINTKVEAQPSLFRGIRPFVIVEDSRIFSFAVPVFPYAGFRDIRSFEKIPDFVKALAGFSIPDGSLKSLPELVNDVNALYNNKFYLMGVILPQLRLNINSKYFNLFFNGGVVNFTKGNIFALEKEIDFLQIRFTNRGSSYVLTEEQSILQIKALTLVGGEFWGTLKVPIKTNKFNLKLLLALGGSLGYLHTHKYIVRIAKRFSNKDLFHSTTLKYGKFIGDMGLRVGFLLGGYKYLRPKFIIEVMGLIGNDPLILPRTNLGLELRVYNLFTFSISILKITDPEVRLEISRKFAINSQIMLGGVLRSKQFESNLGYLTVAVGGKYVKLTTTLLLEKSRIGFLLGVTLGYYP